MEIENIPVLGGTALRNATRTAQKLAGFALRWAGSSQSHSEGGRYLDVGCGNGFITEIVAPGFAEVVGIDVETARLEEFRAHVGNDPPEVFSGKSFFVRRNGTAVSFEGYGTSSHELRVAAIRTGRCEGKSWESKVAFLRHVLDRCEHIPRLRAVTGVSMLKAYRKIRT
jgi:SAM-dependent methyltransferase